MSAILSRPQCVNGEGNCGGGIFNLATFTVPVDGLAQLGPRPPVGKW